MEHKLVDLVNQLETATREMKTLCTTFRRVATETLDKKVVTEAMGDVNGKCNLIILICKLAQHQLDRDFDEFWSKADTASQYDGGGAD